MTTYSTDITSDDKLWALLSYIFPINIIVLLIEDKKNRPFIRYHAITSIGIDVVCLILGVTVLLACLTPIIGIYVIYLMVKAYQGEYVVVWLLTDFMKKQGWLA